MVWAHMDARYAQEVMEEFAEFPHGENDDYVDSGVMAIMRFRQGGFITTPSDFDDDEDLPYRRADYY